MSHLTCQQLLSLRGAGGLSGAAGAYSERRLPSPPEEQGQSISSSTVQRLWPEKLSHGCPRPVMQKSVRLCRDLRRALV